MIGASRRGQGRIRVAGRVVERSGRELWVADAYASLPVQLVRTTPVETPDLVVVEGRMKGAMLVQARLIERHPPSAPQASGEWSRLLWQGLGQRLRMRARALGVVRAYFAEQGFVEVETPLRVPSPGLDLHVDAFEASGRYLITSPEYHMKRLLAGGMPRIFQLAHVSRADESGAFHEPEFTMLEWYRAFAEWTSVVRDTEALVLGVVRALTGRSFVSLPDGRRIDLKPPYERITVREAFRQHASVRDAAALAKRSPNRFFELLVSRVEPALAQRPRPVFLCEYPLSQASLARPAPHDPSVAERFELYVGGIELCNGFGELTDVAEQRTRLVRDRAERRALGRPLYPIDEKFLAALASGMPPSAGNALGFDRLLMLACGAERLGDVQAFSAEQV